MEIPCRIRHYLHTKRSFMNLSTIISKKDSRIKLVSPYKLKTVEEMFPYNTSTEIKRWIRLPLLISKHVSKWKPSKPFLSLSNESHLHPANSHLTKNFDCHSSDCPHPRLSASYNTYGMRLIAMYLHIFIL